MKSDISTRESWAEAKRLGYRWWTVMWWLERDGLAPGGGVKIGPLSIQRWTYHQQTEWYVSFLGRVLLDTYLRRLR